MTLSQEPDLGNVPHVGNDAVEGRLVSDKPRSKWEILLLTVPFFSLQLAWSVQQVFGIPYLSSLGIPDSQIPLLVISGPIAGIIVPPIVAALSETIESPLGKRKPFIFAGGAGTILSFLILAAAEPIAASATNMLLGSGSNTSTTATHLIAGFSMYALNFSIQPLALGLRAAVVDHFGPMQQSDANLWISRFSSMGSIFVALFGLAYSPVFWVLCMVVAAFVGIMLAVVALTGNTGPPGRDSLVKKRNQGTVRSHFIKMVHRARHLPPITRWTCQVQLVSWVAWFFVLNYTSVLASRMYGQSETTGDGVKVSTIAQVDSRKAVSGVALLFHSLSLVSLVLVSGTWGRSSPPASPTAQRKQGDSKRQTILDRPGDVTKTTGAVMETEEPLLSHMDIEGDDTASEVPSQISLEADIYRRRNVLARTVWRPALILLAASVLGTTAIIAAAPYASASIIVASILLGANGALFGLSNWVPYSLIAYEAASRAQFQSMNSEKASALASSWRQSFEGSDEEDVVEADAASWRDGDEAHTDDTPVMLAVHQIAITLPQVIAGIASSLLMQVLEALGIEQGVWCIFALSVPAAIWAACL
ncbi:hypothetical protein GGS21DRAFT_293751 [Xylaria nigripes]|nr:hypothetical protein GGS21DRAFT_293751 [Xylaria nigripes]